MTENDPICGCGHAASEHDKGQGCLHGWTWDHEGYSITDGCECQWAHLSSPGASR